MVNPEPNIGFQSRKKATLKLVSSYQKYARLGWGDQVKTHERQLNLLLSYAVKSSWWRSRITYANLNSKDSFLTKLNKIPILSRTDLQQYGQWMSVWIPGSKPENYHLTQTSGSTGKPVQISKYNPGFIRNIHAIHVLDTIWQRRDMSKPFLHLRANARNFETDDQIEPFCFISPTGKTFSRKLTEISFTEILDLLADKKIKNFLINPLALNVLAKEQLRLKRDEISVDQILSWGDKLDQSTRDLARAAFGARVCDRYSAEEVGYLAIQCPDSEHLHALPFFNFIQILNQNDQPCKIGELGRVIVTSWQSFGQPLVRYEIGDMAAWGEPCKYGITMPVLEPTIVRIREVHVNELGQITFPRLDKTALAKLSAVADYQIAQFTDGIVVIVRTYRELNQDELREIKVDLSEEFPRMGRIEILQSHEIDWLDLWKRKLVVKFNQQIPENVTIHTVRALLKPDSIRE